MCIVVKYITVLVIHTIFPKHKFKSYREKKLVEMINNNNNTDNPLQYINN